MDESSAPTPTPPADALGELAAAVREAGPVFKRRMPASFGTRAGAVFVDAALLFVLTIFMLLVTQAGIVMPRLPPELVLNIYLGTLILYSATEVVGAATPGKSCLELRVARYDGQPTGPGPRAGRWAVRNAPLLLLAAWLGIEQLPPRVRAGVPGLGETSAALGYATTASFWLLAVGTFGALFPARRTLHDWLSRTAVYEQRDVGKGRVGGFGLIFPTPAHEAPPAASPLETPNEDVPP